MASKKKEQTEVRSSDAWDRIVPRGTAHNVTVSSDLTYGYVFIDGQWFKISVERMSEDADLS